MVLTMMGVSTNFRSNGYRPRPLQYLRHCVSEAVTGQGMISVCVTYSNVGNAAQNSTATKSNEKGYTHGFN